MKTRNVVMAVALALGAVVLGFGCSAGPNGSPGSTGPQGQQGSQGLPGAPGHNGTNGSNGSNGATGATGATGSSGSNGSPGAPGGAGEQGPQGADGAPGPIACGNTLIPQDVWHTPCDVVGDPSGVYGLCMPGIVECRLTDNDGQLIPLMMCWDTTTNCAAAVLPSLASQFPNNPVASLVDAPDSGVVVAQTGLCNVDSTCTGVADNTTGVGTNVALVRAALTYLSPVQTSQPDSGPPSGEKTFLAGICRNAAEHCLAFSTCCETEVSNGQVVVPCDDLGNPEQTSVGGNREGVVLADFDLDQSQSSYVAPGSFGSEGLMGTECVDASGSVRLYDCSVNAAGQAVVSCSGAIQ